MHRTYRTIWRAKGLVDDAETIDAMVAALDAAIDDLRAMRDAGIRLDGPVVDDYAHLVTNDPGAAERYGLEEEDLEDDDFEVGPSSGNGHHPE